MKAMNGITDTDTVLTAGTNATDPYDTERWGTTSLLANHNNTHRGTGNYVHHQEAKNYQKTHPDAYCANRVYNSGVHFSRTNVGAHNIQGCSDFVAAEPLCGRKFSFGSDDGWCDCIPLAGGSDGSDTCGPIPYGGYNGYQNRLSV
jgi:hypothetical protein